MAKTKRPRLKPTTIRLAHALGIINLVLRAAGWELAAPIEVRRL